MEKERIVKAREYLLDVADSDESQEIKDILEILKEVIMKK